MWRSWSWTMSKSTELKEHTAFPDLRQFLFDNVASYDELELLLLLQRQPELDWTVAMAAQELGLLADGCQVALENLAAHGLLVLGVNPVTFRYSPASTQLGEGAEQLERAYRKDRFVIVQLMTTNAMDRVRAAALQKLRGAPQPRGGNKLR